MTKTKLEKLKENAERRTIIAVIAICVITIASALLLYYFENFLGAIGIFVIALGETLVFARLLFVLIHIEKSPLYKAYRVEKLRCYMIDKYQLQKNNFTKTEITKYDEEWETEVSVYVRIVSEDEVDVMEANEWQIAKRFTISFCEFAKRYNIIV